MTVPLDPKSAFDDQDAEYISHDKPLLQMSLEEVVDLYYRQECKRSRSKDDEQKAAVQIDADVWPACLKGSLQLFADATPARSVATLTKCAMYSMARWFSDVLGLGDVVEAYKKTDALVRQIPDPFLQKTLLDQLEAATLRLPEPDSGRMQVEVAGWFRSRVGAYASRLGITSAGLVGIGLEWFLTTTDQSELDRTNITHRYQRDARLVEIYAVERLMDFDLLRSKAHLRVEHHNKYSAGR
jgi:hypothetical protein